MAILTVRIPLYTMCLAVLFLLLYRLHKSHLAAYQRIYYSAALCMNISLILMEILWLFLDGSSHVLSNWGVNILYYLLSMYTPFAWFLYVEYGVSSPVHTSRKYFMAVSVPLVIMTVLTLLTPFTHSLFYIDASNQYVRGTLYPLQPLVSYGYLVSASIHALLYAKRTGDFHTRRKYRVLANGILTTVVTGILQIVYPASLTLCMGTTLGFLYVYLTYQEMAISTDALTHLNNRTALYTHLNNIARQASSKKDVYILLLDIDNFKAINDRYGHIEGDHALSRIAECLKESCEKSSDFISRYGGDEFILVHEAENGPEELCDRIEKNLKKTDCPYSLTLSIGSTLYDGDITKVDNFISHADARMYKQKQAKKLS